MKNISLSNKPWLEFDKNDRAWFNSSNHKYGKNADSDAFIIAQDCNGMGGVFYRLISWKDDDRFFDVIGNKDWIFDYKIENMKPEMIVKDKRTDTNYKIVYSERFYKVLEKEK